MANIRAPIKAEAVDINSGCVGGHVTMATLASFPGSLAGGTVAMMLLKGMMSPGAITPERPPLVGGGGLPGSSSLCSVISHNLLLTPPPVYNFSGVYNDKSPVTTAAPLMTSPVTMVTRNHHSVASNTRHAPTRYGNSDILDLSRSVCVEKKSNGKKRALHGRSERSDDVKKSKVEENDERNCEGSSRGDSGDQDDDGSDPKENEASGKGMHIAFFS